jgi:hypothetical protein
MFRMMVGVKHTSTVRSFSALTPERTLTSAVVLDTESQNGEDEQL